MTGLIPLMLSSVGPSSRDSQFFPAPLQLHRRRPSSGVFPAAIPSTVSVSSISSRPTRPKSRRLSISAPAVLPVLPYTAADWRRTISEIKRQYVSRRYRACFTRCVEILDGLKDTSNIEPTYLIYLHFYAATSMETCARPLFPTAPHRAQLLTDARTHYDRAAELIRKAEGLVAPKSRPVSIMSTTSSIHSPAGSVSSRAWTSETDISSPTRSVCSIEDLVGAPSPGPAVARRKKVSFSMPADEPAPAFLRPDSPTLGMAGPAPAARRPPPQTALPEPPTPPPRDAARPDDDDDDDVTPRAAARPSAFDTEPRDFRHLRDALLIAGPVNRYCEGLAALKAQLTAHRSELDALLATPPSPPPVAVSRSTTPTRASEDLRNLDRRARIERLRASGWQRKRFDFRRYEELRSAALAELD